MKKNEIKTKRKEPKKEKMTLEKLARMMAQGFEQMSAEFRSEINSLKHGQVNLEQGQEGLRQEVASLKEDHKDTNRRVVSIERKLSGTLISLDETVHSSEFDKLKHRVEVLES